MSCRGHAARDRADRLCQAEHVVAPPTNRVGAKLVVAWPCRTPLGTLGVRARPRPRVGDFAVKKHDLPRYNVYTKWMQRLFLQAELRHCRDLLTGFKSVLDRIEEESTAAVTGFFPAEHYLVAKSAERTCARARALLRDHAKLVEDGTAERALRERYRAEFGSQTRQGALPAWHVRALGAIRELHAVPEFQRLAINKSMFDPKVESPTESES